MGYEEDNVAHRNKIHFIFHQINLLSTIHDQNKLKNITQELESYVKDLDILCQKADRYKEDSVYNKMYQEAFDLLKECKNINI